jgi:hypothetical protein
MRLLAATLLMLAANAAFAAPPSPESLEKLLLVTGVEKNLAASRAYAEGMMRTMVDQQASRKGMNAEQLQKVEAMKEKVMDAMREEMTYEKTRPFLIRIYSESFTQEEIDGLIAFYESPAGRAFTAKMPVVMQKSMMLMQERMQPLMRRMEAAIKDAEGEAK